MEAAQLTWTTEEQIIPIKSDLTLHQGQEKNAGDRV